MRSARKYIPPPSSYKERHPSPTLTATTSASALDLGDEGPSIVITRSDLRSSVVAYEGLLASAKAYRSALVTLSTATTSFAEALEDCARVKGASASGSGLLAASGLHHMICNSTQVLSDILYRQFEVPLLHAYDAYVAVLSARHADYEALLANKTSAIRRTEAENIKQGRKRNRDLSQFRKALERLQEQVKEVECCKRTYYVETLEGETEAWGMISSKVALLLRSTLDLADRLASKSTSDTTIESMLYEHPDPFDAYRPETEEERDVFSVLPPLRMSSNPANLNHGSRGRNPSDFDRDDPQSTNVSPVKPREETSTNTNITPKQPNRTRVVSVADILGLRGLEAEANKNARSDEPAVSAVSSISGTSPPSAISDLARSPEVKHLPDSDVQASQSPSPPRAAELLPERLLFERSPSKKLTERKAQPPQKVVELSHDVDPMAGDWSRASFDKGISSAMKGGGYDSGDD